MAELFDSPEFYQGEYYDAYFHGWQENLPGKPPLALYNIVKVNHPQFGSTVSSTTLDKLGLTYPPPPPYKGA